MARGVSDRISEEFQSLLRHSRSVRAMIGDAQSAGSPRAALNAHPRTHAHTVTDVERRRFSVSDSPDHHQCVVGDVEAVRHGFCGAIEVERAQR